MENIRLIIWDLDETFWSGTLSEGNVVIPEKHKKIIIELTNRGIVNSICSKNDESKVKDILRREGLWDYFVFPKINWGPKGPAIKEIVRCMKLRPETILFIDDNSTNLAEATYTVPGINVAFPEVIDDILEDPHYVGKDDYSHSRLKQYKILEKKRIDEIMYSDNEEFLRQSYIKVDIHRMDAINQLDRIYELNQRSNQLNFTKKRLMKNDIKTMIEDQTCDTGYVTVQDRYGDYGVIGFFACKDGNMLQFFFSCRTLGLCVEQWVYAQLGFPEIHVIQPIATELKSDFCPDWINVSERQNKELDNSVCNSVKLLMLGGCDLEQTAFYLEQFGIPFDKQFNYVVAGLYDGHPDSSVIIRQSKELSEEMKTTLLKECDFYDNNIFCTKLFDKKYDVVVYSPLIDMSVGLWTRKDIPSINVVYGNRDFPNLTDHGYLSPQKLGEFRKRYSFEGGITSQMLAENLNWIRDNISSETKLIVLNGGENNIKHPLEKNRNKVHIEMNQAIKKFCENAPNTYLIDVRKFINKESDYSDNIRHYTRKGYYTIAQCIVAYLKQLGYVNNVTTIKPQKAKINVRVEVKKILRKMGLLKFGYKIRDKIFKR